MTVRWVGLAPPMCVNVAAGEVSVVPAVWHYSFDLKVKVVGKTEFFFSIDADYTQVKDFGVPKRGFCESKGQNGWLKIPLLACLCYLWVFEKTNMNHKNARSALALS